MTKIIALSAGHLGPNRLAESATISLHDNVKPQPMAKPVTAGAKAKIDPSSSAVGMMTHFPLKVIALMRKHGAAKLPLTSKIASVREYFPLTPIVPHGVVHAPLNVPDPLKTLPIASSPVTLQDSRPLTPGWPGAGMTSPVAENANVCCRLTNDKPGESSRCRPGRRRPSAPI